jgi:RimJ/RimL family protein N-acetyltransferase
VRIETDRLVLRRWQLDDVEPLAAIRSHPEVARWLGQSTLDDTRRVVERFEESFESRGFGRFAVEDRESGALVGWSGLMHAAAWEATPEKDEIGWLVAPDRWGEGLASEAARAALDDAFERVGLLRVIAFALPENEASIRVMERCGMSRGGLGAWHGRPHVWYRADAPPRP